MVMHVMAMQLIRIVQAVRNVDDMKIAMGLVATQLGFQYFALTHHVDIVAANGSAIRIHDYPARWAEYYDGRALGVSDPVHRASHVTSVGFRWSRLPGMIPFTAEVWRVLEIGRASGWEKGGGYGAGMGGA